jgi:membrane-associated phospholipid phosphatase
LQRRFERLFLPPAGPPGRRAGYLTETVANRQSRIMLLWAGSFLIAAGLACLAIDRPAAHLFYDHINEPLFRFLDRTTHWAKGAHWLTAAVVAYLSAQFAMHFMGGDEILHSISKASLAFVASLAAGSAVLHLVKRVFARRRPRDEMEMGLYGFILFSFDDRYNSFPSGHALTIACVAAIVSCVWPVFAAVWFAIALWLGVTRALLTAHFLSDVLVGSGIGILATRETLLFFFPHLAPVWY